MHSVESNAFRMYYSLLRCQDYQGERNHTQFKLVDSHKNCIGSQTILIQNVQGQFSLRRFYILMVMKRKRRLCCEVRRQSVSCVDLPSP